MSYQMPGLPQGMKDVEFMSAKEKEAVLRQWETFLKNGCQRDHFTTSLYHHLVQHCEFIAHYDINGFYEEYFQQGDTAVQFLSQFDRRYHCMSIEYGNNWWIKEGNSTQQPYYDINNAMVDIAAKYIPALVNIFSVKQKTADLEEARKLMRKHGINIQV